MLIEMKPVCKPKQEVPKSLNELWLDMYRENGFKYFVIKVDDFLNAISESELVEFGNMIARFNGERELKGKKKNSYYVMNRDEVPNIKSTDQFINLVHAIDKELS